MLTAESNRKPPQPDPGLCRNCRHSRQMESDRASVFFLCELSRTDSSFAKYPRLPVITCPGYQPKDA